MKVIDPAKKVVHPRTAENLGRFSGLRGEVPIFLLFVAIALLCACLVANNGSAFTARILVANLYLYPQSIAFALAIDATIALAAARPASPIGYLARRYGSQDMFNWIGGRMPSFTVLCLFLPLFAILKPMIPVLNPYSWDMAFIGWDRMLLGADAWRLMQPLLGFPIVTSALSMIYHAWFLLVLPFPVFMLFSRRAASIRRRFLFAYLANWLIVGFFLATAFSSMGPCFLEPLTGNPHFADQMRYLYEANESYPVLVLQVQESLLNAYVTAGPGHGAGITAMPSMHVALAWLAFLAMRHVSKRAGQFFFAFFVLIFIGSVHLAYHYAVDGIVSIFVTSAIWWGTRHLFTWWDRQSLRPAGDATQPAIA